MYALFPVYPLQCGKCGGGIFLWGEQGYVSGFPKTLAPRARRLQGGQIHSRRSQILIAKDVRTKKKKHMTNDVNGMKKKRGRPALGRTRKLTKGVTVKFSPVSYEALRFRAGKSGRSLAVYIREAALAATVTARHTPEENALLRSLAGMANNLNQLTKLSHQTGFYRTKLLIEGLLGKLKRIMNDYRPKGE